MTTNTGRKQRSLDARERVKFVVDAFDSMPRADYISTLAKIWAIKYVINHSNFLVSFFLASLCLGIKFALMLSGHYEQGIHESRHNVI